VNGAEPLPIDDQTLIERCRTGDVAAFEPLVQKYRDRAWRLAFNVLRDREDAWDVTQEAFVRAWQALPSFRGQSAFYTWLFRIVVNVASDRARQRAARGRAFGTERVSEEEWERTMIDQGAAPDDEARRAEERERITRALAALPEHHRTIIMLSDLEGLSYREIAEVLDIPMGTVMSRLHHARRRLRDILGPLLTVLVTVLVTGALALAVPSTAEAQTPGAQVVRFTVQVLLASDGEARPLATPPAATPEDLQQVIPRLYQLFRYKQYQVLQQYRGQSPVGGVQRWPIPGDRTLEMTIEGASGIIARLHVRLQRGSTIELATSIMATPGAPAVIGGPRVAEGVLIVVVRTTP
jgi:RNA polymerase sigma-70 factor (ECF subfamily)